MAGRFPLYTDENVKGQLVKALKERDWDLVRAVDVLPEGRTTKTNLNTLLERIACLSRATGRFLKSLIDGYKRFACSAW